MQITQLKTQITMNSCRRVNLASTLRFFLAVTGWGGEARGAEVGTHVITLESKFHPAEMSRMIASVSAISTSNQVLNSLQAGFYERIISSMKKPSGNPIQGAGISWMISGNLSQLAIRTPFTQSLTKPSTSTGFETINVENESHVAIHIVEVAASTPSPHHIIARVANSGIDTTTSAGELITTMIQGKLSSLIDTFYSASVIHTSNAFMMPPARPVAPEGATAFPIVPHAPHYLRK